jgi:hypothetical protein
LSGTPELWWRELLLLLLPPLPRWFRPRMRFMFINLPLRFPVRR